MKKHTQNCFQFIFATCIALFALEAGATVIYWDPEGSTTQTTANLAGTWTTSASQWSTASTQTASPTTWTSGDAACFCAQSGTAATGAFTVSVSGNITIGGIYNGPLSPAGYNVTIGGSGTLVLASTTCAFATGGSDGDPTIINCVIGGVGPMQTQDGSGLTLNGANTFTGGVEIDGSGGISFGNNAAFGTGTITWQTGGFIQPAVAGTAYNIANPMAHLAGGTETFSGNTGGVTFSGPWTLGGSGTTVTLENIANTITVSGALSGAGGVTINHASTGWTFGGVNTYSGATTITAGTLTIGGAGSLGSGSYAGAIANSGAFVYNSSASQTLSGVISGTGTLTQKGSGTLTLSGDNTYTGATTISGGEFFGVTGGGSASSAVTVSSGATNGVSITANTAQWTNGPTTFSSGTSALDFNFGYSVVPSTTVAPLVVNGAATFTGTPTVTIEAGSLPAGSGIYPLMTWTSKTGTPPASATLPPHVTGSLSNSSTTLYLVVTANTQPIRWTGAADGTTWNIATAVNWDDTSATATTYQQTTLPGDAVVLDQTYISSSPTITLNTTVTPASVIVSNSTYNYTVSGTGGINGAASMTVLGSGTLTLSCANTYTGGTGIATNSTLSIGGAGTITTAGAITNNGTFTYSSSTAQTLSGVVSGTGALNENGTGQLTLSGTANTYTGNTTINGGLLVISADTSLGADPGSAVAANITLNSGLTSANYGLRVSGSLTLNANRGITLGSSGGAIQVPTSDTLTYNGIITGSGSLQEGTSPSVGEGTLLLGGASTYTGSTAIAAGTLELGASGALPSGTPLTVASAAAGGIFNLNNFSQTIGPLSSSTGINGTGTTTPTVSLGSGALTVNETNSTTFLGAITGTGSLVLGSSSTGALTLSGTNTYSGPTAINAGGLTIGGAGELASGTYSGLITNNGTFTYDSTTSQTLSGIISGSGNLSVQAGTLTLNDDNTYTGNTTISGGTVALGTFTTVFGAANGTVSLAGGAINCTANRGTTGAENIQNPVSVTGNSVLEGAATTGSRFLTFGGPVTSTGGSLMIENSQSANDAAIFVVVFTNRVGLNVPVIITNVAAVNFAELAVQNAGSVGDQIYSNTISGPGNILRAAQIAGTGARVILLGTNTYSGGTIDTDGEIACGNSSSGPADAPTNGPIGTGALLVNNVNAKISAYGGAQTIGNHVLITNVNGELTFTGTNALTMSGNLDFSNLVQQLNVANTNLTELSGSILNGGLVVSGGNTLTLAGSNAYTGTTTISNSSTLALASTGSISNSSALSILAGSTLDASAISSFALGSSTNLSASGAAASPATIKGASAGTVNLGSQAITLNFDGTDPALTISQGTLSLNGNAFTVNGSALSLGSYTIILQASGTISNAGTFSVSGTAIGAGTTGSISVSGGNVNLIISETPVFSGLSSATNTYGTPGITLTGTLSGSGAVYPTNGETVSATINGATVNGSVSGSSGAFSIAFNDPSLPTDGVGGSPFTITYTYTGDSLLNAATNTATSLTVIPAALSVTAGAQSKTYGQTVAFGSGSTNFSSVGLQNGETIGSVTLAVSSSGGASNAPVSGSPYTITPSAATGGTFNANNYAIAYATNLLTVNPATLTVTADNYSIPFGATNPVLGVTYSNFVNGETLGASDVGGTPALATGATTNSDVGNYVITNSIGTLTSTNYSFSLVNGTLTITNAISTNTVATGPNPALPGAAVTFTSTLSTLLPSLAVPTNAVQFQIDGTPYGSPVYPVSGVAAFTNSALSHGYHTIEADYGGDTNALGATNILGSTNTVVELINTPPVAGTANYQRTPNSPLIIPISSLLTNATDADGDTLTLVSVTTPSTNGATVSSDTNNVYYVPPATNGNVTDAFLYTVSDPYGATNQGTVVVTIITNSSPSVNITGMTTLPNGTALLNFAGIPGYNYLIEATTNLTEPITWVILSTNMAGTNGLFQYNDLSSTNYPTRYYRTASP